LRNVLERARVISRKTTLCAADLGLGTGAAAAAADVAEPLTLEDVERRHIELVLRRENGKVVRAAQVLGIARSSLYQKLQRYHITAVDEI
ncbi:MAG: helix-turn-helix domain-containing protein, partial [Myxococcales bacterium]